MIITSPLLDSALKINHAFFTRKGGVSEGIYESLNCGPGSNDASESVGENRQIALEKFGGEELLTLYQVHSSRVITIKEGFGDKKPPKADGMVSVIPDITLGVLTADCAPVLFADSKAGVIGAAHAGWKGAFSGIIENTVAAMVSLGAKRENIIAVIGPCISQESYEVGEEFRENIITASFPEFSLENYRVIRNTKETFFTVSQNPDHYLFDLAGYVKYRLTEARIKNIDSIGEDTFMNEDKFFSYRRTTIREEKDYGRQLSAIRLLP